MWASHVLAGNGMVCGVRAPRQVALTLGLCRQGREEESSGGVASVSFCDSRVSLEHKSSNSQSTQHRQVKLPLFLKWGVFCWHCFKSPQDGMGK